MKIINLIQVLSLFTSITMSTVIRIDDVEVPTSLNLDRADILTSGLIDIDLI